MALELNRKNFTPYAPKKGEEYMNARMRSHFRKMLEQLKAELSEEIDRTVHTMQDEATVFADPNDRASQESDMALELRNRSPDNRTMTRQPIIIALDFESAEAARELVSKLGDAVSFYKVGMELYASAGMEFVRELIASRKRVFLDMKFYDIGETVKRAVAQVAMSGVAFCTVHGSKAVMRAAVDGRGDSSLKLLAVTVLTSFDQNDLADLGYPCSVSELVDLRVAKAMEAGVDGLVCSPLEVAAVRGIAGPKAILVTPGVRSAGEGKGDQKRVATPAKAIRNGANYLVIGRQVTRAKDPRAEVLRICEEIATVSQ